ncbi:MAG: hydrolase, partial [Actinobacteria bacterium]
MVYAQGRTYYDADSHIMELPDFLRDYADPDMRERLPQIHVDAPRLKEGLVHALEHRSHRPEQVAEMVALGDTLISGPKGYMALGAF